MFLSTNQSGHATNERMKETSAPARKRDVKKTLIVIILALLALAEALMWARGRAHQSSSSSSSSPQAPVSIDRIVIEKAARRLSTFHDGKLQKSYRVALGREPVGPKEQEGDGKTPEGIFTVDGRNEASDFHLALHLSYPGARASAQADAAGVDPGCDIEIHGRPNGQADTGFHPSTDWTEGCIALTNPEIEELWAVTPVGTVVEIRP